MNTLQDKKILYLIKTMDVGGAERLTLNLCQFFKNHFSQIIIFSSGGLFEKELKDLGVIHINADYANNRDVISLFRIRHNIKKIIKIHKPDIIHCQHRIFLILLETIRKKKFKIIYTANSYFSDILQKLIYPDFAVAVSPTIGKNLQATTLLKSTIIRKINTGVNTKNVIQVEQDKITLGYVGRIINDKGIINIIETVQKLQREGIFVNLLIRGDGNGRTEIQEKITSRQLADYAQIEGPYTDINDLYKEINVLVLPTSMNEGLPISILEAISRKILIVTTKAGGIGDIIEDRVTGFILKNNNPEEISMIIKYILSHKKEVDNIKNNALKILQEQYSIDKMLSGYHKIYEEVFYDFINRKIIVKMFLFIY